MSCDPQTLANEAACIQSCMSPQMVLAAQVKLLCELANTEAARGRVLCGSVAPTGDPGVDCALYFHNTAGDIPDSYKWNDVTGNWVQIV